MKTLLNMALAVLSAAILSTGILSAEYEPSELAVEYYDGFSLVLKLDVKADLDELEIESHELYITNKFTEEGEYAFELLQVYFENDNSENVIVDEDGARWIFQDDFVFEEGEYALKVITNFSNGEEVSSNLAKIQTQGGIYDRIQFTKLPTNKTLKVGELFSFDIDAEVEGDEDAEIEYELNIFSHWGIPVADFEFDKSTGEFSFTPESAGYYGIDILAYDVNNDINRVHEHINLEARFCNNPAKVAGTIKDEEGNTVKTGYVVLLPQNEDPDFGMKENYFVPIEDGTFEINADKGEYQLSYYGDFNINIWYPGTTNLSEAETIVVECGGEYDLSMNVPVYNFDEKTIFGKVTDEDGKGLEYSYVFFDGVHPELGIRYGKDVTTNPDGSYEISLPEGFEYIAMAFSESEMYFRLAPLYYNQTYDYNKAEKILLDEDKDGIDFVMGFDQYLDYFNLSGKVIDENGSPKSGIRVLAEGFRETDIDDIGLYEYYAEAITAEDGTYSMQLPGDFAFTVFAYSYTEEYWQAIYYPQTSNQADAELIRLTGDRNDIDFTFRDIEGELSGSISGNVYNSSGEPIEYAYVDAYLVETDSDLDYLYKGNFMMTDENGQFEIENLIPGKYVLSVFSENPEFMPGFYKEGSYAVMEWEEASLVQVTKENETSGIEIALLSMDEMGEWEEGVINMTGVVETSGKNVNSGDADKKEVPGANIYLKDDEGNVINFNKSNMMGRFNIDRLATGSYTLEVSKVGYHEKSMEINLLDDMDVDMGKIVLEPVAPSSVVDELPEGFGIYPNPARENVRINFVSEGGATIKITDGSQKLVSIENINKAGEITLSRDVSEFAQGIYYLTVITGNESYVMPFAVVK